MKQAASAKYSPSAPLSAFTYDAQRKVRPTFLSLKFDLTAVNSSARWMAGSVEGAGGSFGILIAVI